MIEERLEELLQDFTLEELLEHCNMTPEEALTLLYLNGHLELPEFLKIEVEADDVS